GPDSLDRTSPMFGEWDELIKQLTKRMVKKMQERPELAVEMLFSKIPATIFYLENGYEKQTMSSKPRPPALLEVRGDMTRDEQIGVAVAVCIGDDDIRDALSWVTKSLSNAASERQSWEAESAARRADNPESSEAESKAPSIGKRKRGPYRFPWNANQQLFCSPYAQHRTPPRRHVQKLSPPSPPHPCRL
ncbi:MAG: hypothetical protein Q9183_008079, partial [Haloplaca sp. 2 TL-2023]